MPKNNVELWRESVCNTTRLASGCKTFDKRCVISVHLVYPILTIFFILIEVKILMEEPMLGWE